MVDLDQLSRVFPFIGKLAYSDVLYFIEHTQSIQLSPQEVFLHAGSQKSYIYFIKQGLIRSFYIDERGEEITNLLRYDYQVFAAYEVIFLQQPSRFSFQALEHTELLAIDLNALREILGSKTEFEDGRRFFVNAIMTETLTALNDFILLSPEERYIKFQKEHPDLLNRVPNKYIANVLGITPVSLSRIRKRISQRK
jgi:CRP-like cAMP-binding protein